MAFIKKLAHITGDLIVDGSIEALSDSLLKLSTNFFPEAKLVILK